MLGAEPAWKAFFTEKIDSLKKNDVLGNFLVFVKLSVQIPSIFWSTAVFLGFFLEIYRALGAVDFQN